MNKQTENRTNPLRYLRGRTILVALVVVAITSGLAAFLGIRFYDTKKEVLLQRGELNAKESAIEYNHYLLTRVNIITLVSYSVDNLLASGAENSEIEQYITDETERIIATLDPTTTGLYGWINEEYLDGMGWVPDEDYVPTERPWYTQTMASDQKITFVDPYLDAQTNTVMMTVSALLNDGKSVIAMDVSMDSIQRIVEHVASAAEGSLAFVLDQQGTVIVHSDANQIGRDYLAEPDSLGGMVADRLLNGRQRQFDISTEAGKYSVHVDELEGGWYSVSLINADIWYRPLQHTILLASVLLVLVFVFLALVFLRLNANNQALQTLNTRINLEEQRGKELQVLSETDRMTGLSDRVSGKRKVDELLAAGSVGMFLELDIDHFKSINDTCGHQAGDRAILAVADALRSTFRANDIIMRLGGDEFGVFAVGIAERDLGEATIRRLFSRLETIEIPELRGEKVCVSVGAQLCTGEAERSFDSLYAGADSALYASKKEHGNYLTFRA